MDAGADAGTDGDDTDDWDTEEECPEGWACDEVNVGYPPSETSPTQGEICAVDGSPVFSNGAATVYLNTYSASPNLATGSIRFREQVRRAVIGEPVISVIEAKPVDLYDCEVSDMKPSDEGFTFHAKWPEAYKGTGSGNLVVKTVFEITCSELPPTDGGVDEEGFDAGSAETRLVDAVTYIEWCDRGAGDWGWASSGEVCIHCGCWDGEMAPTPIPPEAGADGIPLPRVFNVNIEKVAALGGSVVLLAEHAGAQGKVNYDWEVSAGTLRDTDQGGVVWDLPSESGPHLVQVAVRDQDSAAVAAMRWEA